VLKSYNGEFSAATQVHAGFLLLGDIFVVIAASVLSQHVALHEARHKRKTQLMKEVGAGRRVQGTAPSNTK